MRIKNHRWAWLTLLVVALANFAGAGDGRWKLASDGTWTRHHLSADGTPLRDMQNVMMRRISQRKRNGGLR